MIIKPYLQLDCYKIKQFAIVISFKISCIFFLSLGWCQKTKTEHMKLIGREMTHPKGGGLGGRGHVLIAIIVVALVCLIGVGAASLQGR